MLGTRQNGMEGWRTLPTQSRIYGIICPEGPPIHRYQELKAYNNSFMFSALSQLYLTPVGYNADTLHIAERPRFEYSSSLVMSTLSVFYIVREEIVM